MNTDSSINLLIYVDQNIWDYMVKDKFPELNVSSIGDVKINLEYIYSVTTLDEIERINNENERQKFLGILRKMNAKYLNLNIDTYEARLEKNDPIERFRNHLENKKDIGVFIEDLNAFTYKMLTGAETRTYKEIWSSYYTNLLQMLKSILDDTVDPEDVVNRKALNKEFDDLKGKLELLPDIMVQSVPFEALEANNLKKMKEALPYDLSSINNIHPEKVIDHIWEKVRFGYKEVCSASDRIEECFEKVFSENKAKKKWGWLEKINLLYSFLNYYGYWQDKKLEKRRKFIPSLNDASHSFYASYSNFFLTRDYRMYMKLRAVYHYYNIKTVVLHINETTLGKRKDT